VDLRGPDGPFHRVYLELGVVLCSWSPNSRWRRKFLLLRRKTRFPVGKGAVLEDQTPPINLFTQLPESRIRLTLII
jgi:hypothetical protein